MRPRPGVGSCFYSKVPPRATVLLHPHEAFATQCADVVRDRLLADAETCREILLRRPTIPTDKIKNMMLQVTEPDAPVPRDLHRFRIEPLEDPVPLRLDEPLHLQRPEVVRQGPVRDLQRVLQTVVVLAGVRRDVPVNLPADEVVEDLLALQARVQREDDEVREPVLA